MNQTELLHTMCHDVLSNADVKAISKSRGFSDVEAGTRALFESFFLSEIGVAQVMQELSRKEIVLLHLLHTRDQLVDIAFFARAYGETTRSYGTFTQQYQSVFQAVREALVRRGLLLMAEAGNGDTKMERWRFQFPQQFAHLLPPLLETPATIAAEGTVNQELVRAKVMTLLKAKRFGVHVANFDKYKLEIVDGDLRMGAQRFAVSTLQAMQIECWEAASPKPTMQKIYVRKQTPDPSLIEAARYAFGQLGTDEWLTPPQLDPILEIFCDKPKVDPEKLCEAGWEWGCLARHTAKGQAHYRLPTETETAKRRPGAALTVTDTRIEVELERIDYADLEVLARIADWRVEKGQLLGVPSLVKVGNLTPTDREHPLLQWLETNASVYAGALRTVQQRWGKTIVHENLLVAKVNDLTLKVAIEKALGDDDNLLLLPNN
ncbi:MAG: hypothetical protein KDE19_05100, partial [Caldilineaceae bacterium]|nr:hypothetical protein [Caldilineaceae bacterium]